MLCSRVVGSSKYNTNIVCFFALPHRGKRSPLESPHTPPALCAMFGSLFVAFLEGRGKGEAGWGIVFDVFWYVFQNYAGGCFERY